MNDVALVTGAGGALGGEVARQLRARGYRLALLDSAHGKERVERLAGELGAWCAAGDVAEAGAWKGWLAGIEAELGAAPSVAALVAGAWAGGRPLHEETNDEAWRSMLGANLETVYRSLRSLLP